MQRTHPGDPASPGPAFVRDTSSTGDQHATLLQEHLDHISPMSAIFLSMVHQIYEPNYLKFHISQSCSKEGRLTHPLSGFLFKPHYHKVKSRHFTACSPAYAFSDPTFHTGVPITLAKRTNSLKRQSLFFLCRHPSCDLAHKWYKW